MKNTLNKILTTISSQLIEWADGFVEMLPRIIVAVLTIMAFAILSRLARKLVGVLMMRLSSNTSLIRLSKTVAYISVTTVGIFIALSILQLDKTVTSLLAGVGVIGLALGFAFQETASNFMSGVFLAINRPYSVGDVVQVGDAFGVVKELDLRTTCIENWNGQDIIIPNKEFFQGRITNYSANKKRRIEIEVGVSYGDDIELAQKVTREAVEAIEDRHPDFPVDVFYQTFSNSSINMVIHLWIVYDDKPRFFHVRDEAIKNIKAAYDKNGITIPFPIRTLDFGIKGGEKLNAMLKERI
ncbi:MAG: mechanosensitive ion channel family protein [Salibacteraceae bacterium]